MGIMEVLEELDEPQAPAAEPAAEQEAPEVTETEEITAVQETEPVPEAEEAEPETPEEIVIKKPLGIRPEWVLAALAVLAAVALGVVLVLSLPYMGTESEDPEALPDRNVMEVVTLPTRETILEPTVSETEPENPTIPPERNPYDRFDFQYNRHNYLLLQNVQSFAGVDVSAYQGEIDWEKVKQSGIDFAIIRLGYRGYESGKLVEDKYAKENLKGAKEAGLRVGAYFFSQALSIKETDQEIAYMLEILGDTRLDMPIVLDWEIPAADARTARMDKQTLTDIQRHFCGQMVKKGYTPMIYFNWHQSENLYSLHDLEEYPFWLALYQDRMTYPWRVEMWQWTDKGSVPGIAGPVDLNVYMPH